MTDRDLMQLVAGRTALSALLADSGLSVSEFARTVIARDPRTVRRWLSGELEVPQCVAQWVARVDQIAVTPRSFVVRVTR